MKKIELTEEDYKKEDVMDNLLESDIEKLKHIHAESYSGTDDRMSDDFENWLVDLTSDDITNLIK